MPLLQLQRAGIADRSLSHSEMLGILFLLKALAFLVLPREHIVLLLPVLLVSLVTSRNLLAWDAQSGRGCLDG